MGWTYYSSRFWACICMKYNANKCSFSSEPWFVLQWKNDKWCKIPTTNAHIKTQSAVWNPWTYEHAQEYRGSLPWKCISLETNVKLQQWEWKMLAKDSWNFKVSETEEEGFCEIPTKASEKFERLKSLHAFQRNRAWEILPEMKRVIQALM